MIRYSIPFILLLSNTVFASNFYIDAGVGGFFSNSNSSFTADSTSVLYSPTAPGTSLFSLPNVNWKNSFDNGVNASLAVGYHFTPCWRSEVEFFFQNTKRHISGTYDWLEINSTTRAVYARSLNNPITKTSSNANIYSFMTNVYYDFRNNSKWTPFVGLGVGITWMYSGSTNANGTLNVDDPSTPLAETAPVMQHSPSLNSTAFAWQFKAGISYALHNNQLLKLIYRLYGTSQFNAGTSWITSNPGRTGESQFNVSKHNVSGILTNALEVHYSFDV